MSNAGGVVVAMRMRKERHLIAALREGGATSASSAMSLDAPRGMAKSVLRSLIRKGAVIEAGLESTISTTQCTKRCARNGAQE